MSPQHTFWKKFTKMLEKLLEAAKAKSLDESFEDFLKNFFEDVLLGIPERILGGIDGGFFFVNINVFFLQKNYEEILERGAFGKIFGVIFGGTLYRMSSVFIEKFYM